MSLGALRALGPVEQVQTLVSQGRTVPAWLGCRHFSEDLRKPHSPARNGSGSEGVSPSFAGFPTCCHPGGLHAFWVTFALDSEPLSLYATQPFPPTDTPRPCYQLEFDP